MRARSSSAAIADRRASSSRLRNDPVGLFGLTTMTARGRLPARRAAGDRLGHAAEVDVPDTIERQPVADRDDPFETRQVLEQRVARLGNQHGVSGVAAELEQEAVRLAGAGGEHHALRIDRDAGAGVVGGDRGARARLPQRRRVVGRDRGPGQRGGDRLVRIGEPDAGRVRLGQVERAARGGRRATAPPGRFRPDPTRAAWSARPPVCRHSHGEPATRAGAGPPSAAQSWYFARRRGPDDVKSAAHGARPARPF